MANASWAQGAGRDDGWGPATSVRSSSANAGSSTPTAPPGPSAPVAPGASSRDHAPSRPTRTPRAQRAGKRPAEQSPDGWQSGPPRSRSVAEQVGSAHDTAPQRGLRAWAALLVLIGIMVLGLLVDGLRGQQLGTGFDLGIIIGSAVAIIVVRRAGMFWIVVSPPLVYSIGAGLSLYLRSGGLHDRGVLIDAATNWLVYGFPAIAGASAAVLIIAGIRLILRK